MTRRHIDGAHFQPHRLGSTGQSIIVLPVFGDVAPVRLPDVSLSLSLSLVDLQNSVALTLSRLHVQGGGATAIVAGSHKVMGEFLRKQEPEGCSYMRLFYQAHYVCVPGSSAARPRFCCGAFAEAVVCRPCAASTRCARWASDGAGWPSSRPRRAARATCC